jgi:hypothetical protein
MRVMSIENKIYSGRLQFFTTIYATFSFKNTNSLLIPFPCRQPPPNL